MSVRLITAVVLASALAGPAVAEARPGTATPVERLQKHRVPLDGKKVAQAPAVKVTCEYIEITAATGKDASIDPALKQLEKKLKKQPWSFNQYKLLSRGEKALEKGKAETLSLKGGSASLSLVEIVDKSKARLTVSEDHGGKRVVNNTTTIAAGDWLIVGHPVPPNNDGHLLAVSCK